MRKIGVDAWPPGLYKRTRRDCPPKISRHRRIRCRSLYGRKARFFSDFDSSDGIFAYHTIVKRTHSNILILITALQRRTSVTKAHISTHERHRSVPPAAQFGGAGFAPQESNCRYVQAAAAMRGPLIEKGLWCSKTRSRRPTIVYFGLWVGGRKAAISLRKWW